TRSRSSQVCSPVSATSSRGTKRAAAADSPAGGEAGHEDHHHGHHHGTHDADEAEDDATLAHRFLPKRLRKTAARDISLPGIRSPASRRNLRSAVAAARRNLLTGPAASASASQTGPSTSPMDHDHHHGGRVPCDAVSPAGSSSRKIKQPTSARRTSRAKAAAAGSTPVPVYVPAPAPVHAEAAAAPLSVVPDANRGIPSVPVIPAKFTYGEDRENGAPWRGLRRG
ncbi:hypothetical protein E4U41_004007, partial [Claviceps citrina]